MNSVYSVAQINSYIKNMFEQDYLLRSVYVKGELSNVKYHSSGHIYFTMKDADAALNCVMYKSSVSTLKFRMQEGQQIICFGTVSTFPRDGKYQLYAKQIVLDGAGQLYQRFEQLKRELEEMGMFSKEYKKPIPRFAQKIGIVTANTGAAIQDIINISTRRNPYVQLILYPAKVQGEGSAESIVNGIRALDRYGVDTIIVGRGGGSIEDLWAFNEEIVARAIFECETPIVSAVGHETDTTIADYVADLRAPTPSAAAELTVFSFDEFEAKCFDLRTALRQKMQYCIENKRRLLKNYTYMVDGKSPENQLRQKTMEYMVRCDKLSELMDSIVNDKRHKLDILVEQMKALSPLDKISKGYAYVSSEGKSVKTVKDVRVGQMVTLSLKDGKVVSEVIEIDEK